MKKYPIELSIIIVSYNTRSLLKNCLKTVFDNVSKSKEVIVIDNSSSDGSADMVAQNFKDVILIRCPKNYGYNHGNNLGIKRARGKYLFFLNPDTMVTKNSVESMVGFLDEHKKVGVIGPQIVNLFAEVDLSAYPLPNLIDVLEEGIFTYTLPRNKWLSRLVYRRKYLEAIQKQEVFTCGWVSGAAFIIRGDIVDKLGTKDENLYSYAEEADWGLKVKSLNYKTVYFPEAQIIHIGSASSNQNWENKTYRVQSAFQERLYFTKKHFKKTSYYFVKYWLFFEIWLKKLLRMFFTWQEPKRSKYLEAYDNALEYLIADKYN